MSGEEKVPIKGISDSRSQGEASPKGAHRKGGDQIVTIALVLTALLSAGAMWRWKTEGQPVAFDHRDLGTPFIKGSGGSKDVKAYLVFDYLCGFSRAKARDLGAASQAQTVDWYLVMNPLWPRSWRYAELSIAASRSQDVEKYRKVHKCLIEHAAVEPDRAPEACAEGIPDADIQAAREILQRHLKFATANIGQRTPGLILEKDGETRVFPTLEDVRTELAPASGAPEPKP